MKDIQQTEKPILPMKDFKYHTPLNFHKCQTLKFENGFAIQKERVMGIGGERLLKDINPLSQDDIEEISSENQIDPSRDGKTRVKPPPPFIPKFCFLDKKVLRFFGYFEEIIFCNNDNQDRRYRYVEIHYYLEDDTISVVEPKIQNSGLYQGTLLKRHRIAKNSNNDWDTFWHWTDFNIGVKPIFYGREYIITSCDGFTKSYLESEGVEIELAIDTPTESLTASRNKDLSSRESGNLRPPKLSRYMKNDSKVLRFYAKSELPHYPLGAREDQKYIIHFYLSDHSIEIRENRDTLQSREPFAKFLSRRKIEKQLGDKKEELMPSEKRHSEEYFTPEDFVLGKETIILKKRFYIYDCDGFTSNYYLKKYGINMSKVKTDSRPSSPKIQQIYPPIQGIQIGTPEDNLQNCLRLIPKPPRKNVKNIIENLGKTLRFQGILNSVRKEHAKRRFVFTYYLADDTVSIFEFCPPNSGWRSGKYLQRTKLIKPAPKIDGEVDYYTLTDFYPGSQLYIYKRLFEITELDEQILKYIDENENKLEAHWTNSIKQYFLLKPNNP